MRWTFYGSVSAGDTVKGSSLVKFMGDDNRESAIPRRRGAAHRGPPPVRVEPKPKGPDASALAGMIKAYLERQAPIERNHLKAKYLVGALRSSARRRIVRPVHTRVSLDWLKIEVTTQLVAEFYGKPLDTQELAERYDIGRHRLELARRKVQITLDAVSTKAEDAAYDHFRKGRVLA